MSAFALPGSMGVPGSALGAATRSSMWCALQMRRASLAEWSAAIGVGRMRGAVGCGKSLLQTSG